MYANSWWSCCWKQLKKIGVHVETFSDRFLHLRQKNFHDVGQIGCNYFEFMPILWLSWQTFVCNWVWLLLACAPLSLSFWRRRDLDNQSMCVCLCGSNKKRRYSTNCHFTSAAIWLCCLLSPRLIPGKFFIELALIKWFSLGQLNLDTTKTMLRKDLQHSSLNLRPFNIESLLPLDQGWNQLCL